MILLIETAPRLNFDAAWNQKKKLRLIEIQEDLHSEDLSIWIVLERTETTHHCAPDDSAL